MSLLKEIERAQAAIDSLQGKTVDWQLTFEQAKRMAVDPNTPDRDRGWARAMLRAAIAVKHGEQVAEEFMRKLDGSGTDGADASPDA